MGQKNADGKERANGNVSSLGGGHQGQDPNSGYIKEQESLGDNIRARLQKRPKGKSNTFGSHER